MLPSSTISMFGFLKTLPISQFETHRQWRHWFMRRRLQLGITFGIFYFLTFLPLDVLTYFNSGRNSLQLLWIAMNLGRVALLGCCMALLHYAGHRRRSVMLVFLLASWAISLPHRFYETYVSLSTNTPVTAPDMFSWALSFITQATLVPVSWPLHLISQLGAMAYYFGVNSLLGLQVLPPGLSAASMLLNIFWICCICNFAVYFYEQLSQDNFDAHRQLMEAKHQSEQLLLNILPRPIAEQLKQGPEIIAESFAEVTVLFADLVKFTQLTESQHPAALVDLLNQVFSRFDQLADHYGLEKIKTIGDAYMVASGLPQPRLNHVEAVASMALDMQRALEEVNASTGQQLSLRIGIHTGPVVAGVIGLKKFAYDLWGDTVNTASRMESHGIPGEIHISQVTYGRLSQHSHLYQFEERGPVMIKGKGSMLTYLLKPAVSGQPTEPAQDELKQSSVQV